MLKFFLGGVSGFSFVKGVFNFIFWFLFVVLFFEGGCDVFFGNGVKILVFGLIGWLGNEKFFGFDNVCLCKVDCFIYGERDFRVWELGFLCLVGGLCVG